MNTIPREEFLLKPLAVNYGEPVSPGNTVLQSPEWDKVFPNILAPLLSINIHESHLQSS